MQNGRLVYVHGLLDLNKIGEGVVQDYLKWVVSHQFEFERRFGGEGAEPTQEELEPWFHIYPEWEEGPRCILDLIHKRRDQAVEALEYGKLDSAITSLKQAHNLASGSSESFWKKDYFADAYTPFAPLVKALVRFNELYLQAKDKGSLGLSDYPWLEQYDGIGGMCLNIEWKEGLI